jgi:hypothetical protein
MIHLDFSTDEVKILASVLESYLSELRMEIADTDNHDFREMLKERKAVLEKTLAMLGHPVGSN